jgi:glutamine synthetase type III
MKELAKFADSVFNPAKSIISKARKTSDGTQYVDFAQSKKISSEDADVIAKEVLEWAKTRGVTHYTFWVQPFTN